MTIFGGWSMEKECFDKILEILPNGKTILEFGSGAVTNELAKHYKMYSVENDSAWCGKYKSTYINAPLVKQEGSTHPWYDVGVLKKGLPDKYDLILIDGPVSSKSNVISTRYGFYNNIDLFNLNNVILVFDDIQRIADYNHMVAVSEKINRDFVVYKHVKNFGIIF